MRIRVMALFVMVGLVACTAVPEPETPVAPTKRAPQREPLPQAPSNSPDMVIGCESSGPKIPSLHAEAAW